MVKILELQETVSPVIHVFYVEGDRKARFLLFVCEGGPRPDWLETAVGVPLCGVRVLFQDAGLVQEYRRRFVWHLTSEPANGWSCPSGCGVALECTEEAYFAFRTPGNPLLCGQSVWKGLFCDNEGLPVPGACYWGQSP